MTKTTVIRVDFTADVKSLVQHENLFVHNHRYAYNDRQRIRTGVTWCVYHVYLVAADVCPSAVKTYEIRAAPRYLPIRSGIYIVRVDSNKTFSLRQTYIPCIYISEQL